MDFSAASLDHLGSAASLLLQRGQFKSSHPTDMQRSIFHRLNSSTSSCMRRTCHPRLLSPALAPRHPRLCAAQAAPDPDAVSSTAATDTAADNTTTSSSGQQQQHCRVRFRGTAFDVPQGTKLRTALLRNGVSPHNGKASIINCRGLGTCGTCAVEIRGSVLPAAWTAAEQLRLNFPPHKAPNNQRLRLACQVCVEGPDVEVIKRDRFWGQGDVVLGPAQAGEYSGRLPLGELEFLLDPGDRGAGGQQQ